MKADADGRFWLTMREGALCGKNSMMAAKYTSDRTVRITVKVRPDEYDKFCRHVHNLGSNLSAFFRESAVKAMQEYDRASLAALSSSSRCRRRD
jgi:hypothetical protein